MYLSLTFNKSKSLCLLNPLYNVCVYISYVYVVGLLSVNVLRMSVNVFLICVCGYKAFAYDIVMVLLRLQCKYEIYIHLAGSADNTLPDWRLSGACVSEAAIPKVRCLLEVELRQLSFVRKMTQNNQLSIFDSV